MAFTQIHLVNQLQPFLNWEALPMVTHALVTSHLNYSNMCFIKHLKATAGPKSSDAIWGIPYYSRVIPLLCELHWLPGAV